jgi:hypothetical protein
MENHHDHHEEPKPSNKWITTPIIMAILVIGCIVTFLGVASGTCCNGKCNEKTKTEQHDVHMDSTDYGDQHNEERENADAVKDSTGVDSTTNTHEHTEGSEHGDTHGH